MTDSLYPLKFQPILKERIWGGKKLKTYLNKITDSPIIGESWEISNVENDVSIVSNGYLKGQSLRELLYKYGSDLVGRKNYERFGDQFPLLIKFIDAKEDLSIQLHPDDSLAKKRHNSFGKTEMWYVMQANEASYLIVGFNQEMNKQTYLKHLRRKTLKDILNFDKVKQGDTYLIEAGRIHAIGAGVLLAEIQQTSNITYRVYDWDRVDKDGNKRELHNDLAMDAIDFEMENDFRVQYNSVENVSNPMVKNPYFTTNYLQITTQLKKENTHDSFIIYMCVNGGVSIITGNHIEILKKGETLLLPAKIKDYQLVSDNAELLEVYV